METALLPISTIVFFILMAGLVAGLVRLVPDDEASQRGIPHLDRPTAEEKPANAWRWRASGVRQSARRKARPAA